MTEYQITELNKQTSFLALWFFVFLSCGLHFTLRCTRGQLLKSRYTNHKFAALFQWEKGSKHHCSSSSCTTIRPSLHAHTDIEQDKNICLWPLHVINQSCVTLLTTNLMTFFFNVVKEPHCSKALFIDKYTCEVFVYVWIFVLCQSGSAWFLTWVITTNT